MDWLEDLNRWVQKLIEALFASFVQWWSFLLDP